MIAKSPGSTPETMRVTFQIPSAIWADSVYLVGDFNGWSPASVPLQQPRDDSPWEVTLELPRGHTYPYRYLLNDSEWCNDCQADAYLPGQDGGVTSAVRL